MRRVLLVLPVALLLAGCGGKTITPTPQQVVGTLPQPTETTAGPTLPQGNASAGRAIFATSGCSACHTMKAANATGTVGPNLDELKPPLDKIQSQVVNGGGGMPPFKGNLSNQQIADVSQFVFESTH
jgi:mono/diheme cytochrome c family protein